MAWNEPGGGDNRDPWSGGRSNQGPPDLDEIFRKLRDRVDRLFGGRRSRSGGSGGGDGGGGFSAVGIGIIAVILLLGWLASGFYIVDAGWRGVETRFGAHVDTTRPGPHWHLPYPVGDVMKVNVAERRHITIGYAADSPSRSRAIESEALMLTRDENIVSVQLAVQYSIADPAAYLFNFQEPDQTLKQVSESALRQVVGKREMDFVLTEGRAEVAQRTRELVQQTLDQYNAGLQVIEVAIQDVQPPEPVQDAFVDAIRAREDKQRLINEAQAYANEIIPKAQGQAARIRAEAEGYRATVIAQAKGETSRFLQIAGEHEQAPDITRERLYLETMQTVLSDAAKVVVDTQSGAPISYLPLDRLMQRSRRSSDSTEQQGGQPPRLGTGGGEAPIDGESASRMRARGTR